MKLCAVVGANGNGIETNIDVCRCIVLKHDETWMFMAKKKNHHVLINVGILIF